MQVVFDNWKFREILKSIVEKKELNGDRISSKQQLYMRIGEPNLFRKNNHLEEIIENSYGGVIVLDLSEKFGCDPVDYVMASQYLEKLIKKRYK